MRGCGPTVDVRRAGRRRWVVEADARTAGARSGVRDCRYRACARPQRHRSARWRPSRVWSTAATCSPAMAHSITWSHRPASTSHCACLALVGGGGLIGVMSGTPTLACWPNSPRSSRPRGWRGGTTVHPANPVGCRAHWRPIPATASSMARTMEGCAGGTIPSWPTVAGLKRLRTPGARISRAATGTWRGCSLPGPADSQVRTVEASAEQSPPTHGLPPQALCGGSFGVYAGKSSAQSQGTGCRASVGASVGTVIGTV